MGVDPIADIRVGYIVVGEDVTSNLLRRQVLELLSGIVRDFPGIRIKIINIQNPLFFFRRIFTLCALKRRIKVDFGLDIVFIPSVSPWPLPHLLLERTDVGWRPPSIWDARSAKWFLAIHAPIVRLLFSVFRLDVVHCRSYPAALLGAAICGTSVDHRLVFDPRSDFPEEGVTSGHWEPESVDFNFWKTAEKMLLGKAAAVAVIGPSYERAYRSVVPHFRGFLAPNNVDFSRFGASSLSRERLRRKFGIADTTTVFVYSGALSEKSWHRPSYYLAFYRFMQESGLDFRLLLISQDLCRDGVSAVFAGLDRCILVSPGYEEVPDYLMMADLGLMFLGTPKVAVGTKVGEYLACGLPVLANVNCLGALEVFSKISGSGVVLNLGLGGDDVAVSADVPLHSVIRGNNLRSAAEAWFSNLSVAATYVAQYRSISRKRFGAR